VAGPGELSARAAAISEVTPSSARGKASSTKLRQLRLRQRSIRPARVSITEPGLVTVPIKLTKVGKALLRRDRRLKVRVNARFLSVDGSSVIWKLKVVLKKRPTERQKAQRRAP
jgi:hypothetical protein